MEPYAPLAEHLWLKQFVGNWKITDPENPSHESFTMLGELWLSCHGRADDGSHNYWITFGFDPEKGKFVGTFISSLACHLWIYEGWREGNTLILESKGPSMANPAETATYRDYYEIEGDNKVLYSRYEKDGEWTEFMRAPGYRID